jgi:polar amino acid transport system substrate-binding protein
MRQIRSTAARTSSRRDFIRTSAIAGLGLAVAAPLLEACSSSSSAAAGGQASGGTLAAIRKSGYARLSSYQQPPHGWFDNASGQWKGIDVDIIQYILPKIGVKHWDYVTADWNAMIPGLQADRWDMMSIGMSYTALRAKQVAFSVPCYQYGEAMIVPKGNPKNITGQAQWPGHKIGGILGSVDDQVIGGVKGATYVPFQKYSDMYADLADGRIDAGLVDELEVVYDFQQTPEPTIEILHQWQGKTTYLTGVVMRQSDTQLKQAVDAVIVTMKSDGTMLQFLQKYGLGQANAVSCTNPTAVNSAGALQCAG